MILHDTTNFDKSKKIETEITRQRVEEICLQSSVFEIFIDILISVHISNVNGDFFAHVIC